MMKQHQHPHQHRPPTLPSSISSIDTDSHSYPTHHMNVSSPTSSQDSHSIPTKKRKKSDADDADKNDKKSRISMPCDICRKRKRKCDGTKPVCKSCQELNRKCVYSMTSNKRGPKPGVAQRLKHEIKQLENELNILRKQSSISIPSSITSTSSSLSSLQLLHSIPEQDKNYMYLQAYLCFVNQTLCSFVDDHEMMREYQKMNAEPPMEPSLPFTFQYLSCIAVGALIHGDMIYANEADKNARTACSHLFDTPNLDVIRALSVLSLYCHGIGAIHRTTCYVAIANRMLSMMIHIPTISSHITDELRLLIDMCEDLLHPMIWNDIEIQHIIHNNILHIENDIMRKDKEEYEKMMSSPSSIIHDNLNLHTIRAAIIRTLCLIFATNPSLSPSHHSNQHSSTRLSSTSIYRLLIIFIHAEHTYEKILSPPMYTLVLICKAIVMYIISCMNDINAITSITSDVIQAINIATSSAKSNDVIHLGIYAILYHMLARIHLTCNNYMYTSYILDLMEKITMKWSYATSILKDIQMRIATHVMIHYPHIASNWRSHVNAEQLASFATSLLSSSSTLQRPISTSNGTSHQHQHQHHLSRPNSHNMSSTSVHDDDDPHKVSSVVDALADMTKHHVRRRSSSTYDDTSQHMLIPMNIPMNISSSSSYTPYQHTTSFIPSTNSNSSSSFSTPNSSPSHHYNIPIPRMTKYDTADHDPALHTTHVQVSISQPSFLFNHSPSLPTRQMTSPAHSMSLALSPNPNDIPYTHSSIPSIALTAPAITSASSATFSHSSNNDAYYSQFHNGHMSHVHDRHLTAPLSFPSGSLYPRTSFSSSNSTLHHPTSQQLPILHPPAH